MKLDLEILGFAFGYGCKRNKTVSILDLKNHNGSLEPVPKVALCGYKWQFSALRCSRTLSTLRSGTRKSPFSHTHVAF